MTRCGWDRTSRNKQKQRIVTMSEHPSESVNQIDEYIAKCRAMHASHVAPVPRFAHAVSALADERDALLDRVASLEQAIWEACDSFRSLGRSADADDLEDALNSSKGRAQSARKPRYQDRPTAADSAVGTTVTVTADTEAK